MSARMSHLRKRGSLQDVMGPALKMKPYKLPIIFFLSIAALIVAYGSATLQADERLQFADGLYAREMFDLASVEYAAIIEASPDYTNIDAVYYRLADCYRYLGDPAKAERYYAKVFKDYPDGEFALKAGVKRADIFVQDKRFEEGAELYKMVLARNPPEPIGSACIYFLGDSFLAQGKTNEAEKAYSQVAQKFLSSDYYPFALIRLAEIASAEGRSPEAVLRFYRAASTNNIAPTIAAEALYQMARIHFAGKDYEASSLAFENLAVKFPDDPRTRASRLDAAWAEYSAGLVSESLTAAMNALKSDPPQDEAAGWIYLKANCERALGKYKEAIESYSQITGAVGPRSHIYIYERALCFYARGDYKRALEDLKKVESKDDIREDVLWLTGRAFHELKDKDLARQYFGLLINEFPKGRFTAQAMYRIAGIQSERNEHQSSASLYANLAKQFPDDPLAARSLLAEGSEWVKAGEPAKAVSAWDKMIESYSSSEQVQDALLSKAVALINLKRNEDAERTIDQFIKLHPGSSKLGEAWFWKGVILAHNGKNTDAESSFSKALKLDIPEDLKYRARAYKALAIYGAGDEKKAADELQALNHPRELAYAGRNIILWLTTFRLQNNDHKSALNAAEKLLSLSEVPIEKQEAHCLIGRACLAASREKEALDAYRAAEKTGPDSIFKAEAYLALANAAAAKSDFESAETQFYSASRLSQGDDGIGIRARSYMGLGRLYEQQGDYPKAARLFMSVAVLFDDGVLVPEALKSAARCFAEQGLKKESEQAMAELHSRYPEEAVDKAESK